MLLRRLLYPQRGQAYQPKPRNVTLSKEHSFLLPRQLFSTFTGWIPAFRCSNRIQVEGRPCTYPAAKSRRSLDYAECHKVTVFLCQAEFLHSLLFLPM